MKKRFQVTLDEGTANKLEKIGAGNLSNGIRMVAEKYNPVKENLREFVVDVTMDRNNIDIILDHFKKFKDAQHFANYMCWDYARRATDEYIKANTTEEDGLDGSHMNEAMKKFMLGNKSIME